MNESDEGILQMLDEASAGFPVHLTKNGRGRSAVLDIRDYERIEAEQTLLSELERGKRSAEECMLTSKEAAGLFADRFPETDDGAALIVLAVEDLEA